MTTKVKTSVMENTTVTAGTYGSSSTISTFTVDAQGRITSASSVSPTTWNQNTTGSSGSVAYSGLTGTVPTWNQNTTGSSGSVLNALSAGTGLSYTSSAADFNGSGARTLNLANTGVASGSYTGSNVTVNAQGQITSISSGSGGFSNMDVYTNSGTWTVPSGVTKCKVTLIGGGGGGGTASGSSNMGIQRGGFGGSGGHAIKYITGLSAGQSVSYTAGNGSTGVGGTASFGSYFSATGGAKGGDGVTYQVGHGATGQFGVGVSGNFNSLAANVGSLSTNYYYYWGYGIGGAGGQSAGAGGVAGVAGCVIIEY